MDWFFDGFSILERKMAEQVATFTERLNEAMAVRGLKQADVMRMSDFQSSR